MRLTCSELIYYYDYPTFHNLSPMKWLRLICLFLRFLPTNYFQLSCRNILPRFLLFFHIATGSQNDLWKWCKFCVHGRILKWLFHGANDFSGLLSEFELCCGIIFVFTLRAVRVFISAWSIFRDWASLWTQKSEKPAKALNWKKLNFSLRGQRWLLGLC